MLRAALWMVRTLRELMIISDQCSIDKSTGITVKLLEWLHVLRVRIDGLTWHQALSWNQRQFSRNDRTITTMNGQ
jgi:hypothetical protein